MWFLFIAVIYFHIVILDSVIWHLRPIHTVLSTKCHTGEQIDTNLYV